MTDYNDGQWHGWNGGECPVHPKSEVQAVWRSDHDVRGDVRYADQFQDSNWQHTSAGGTSDIIAFRVIKAHREPREWWLRLDTEGDICGTDNEDDPPPNWDPSRTIRVREVLE